LGHHLTAIVRFANGPLQPENKIGLVKYFGAIANPGGADKITCIFEKAWQ